MGTVIYLFERTYLKVIYLKELRVLLDIFNVWSRRSIIWSDIKFCFHFFLSDRMSGVLFVWSHNSQIWSDIVRCPTVFLRHEQLICCHCSFMTRRETLFENLLKSGFNTTRELQSCFWPSLLIWVKCRRSKN